MNSGYMIGRLKENLLEVAIPDKIPKVHYFLEGMNRPEWILGIRILCCLGLTFVFLTYIYYARKDKKTKDEHGEG